MHSQTACEIMNAQPNYMWTDECITILHVNLSMQTKFHMHWWMLNHTAWELTNAQPNCTCTDECKTKLHMNQWMHNQTAHMNWMKQTTQPNAQALKNTPVESRPSCVSEDSPPRGSASVGKLVGSIPLPSNTASMKWKAERVQGPQRASLPYAKALS